MKSNIVLIGMPGSGKSTIGVLLAKAMGKKLVDTDAVIQEKYGDKLQSILDTNGVDAFIRLEEDTVAAFEAENTVIATGGSVIYGPRAMAHLRENGVIVYIKLPYETIEQRINNMATRGIALRAGQTLRDLYNERIPLYEAGCDVCFEPGAVDIEASVAKLCALLASRMQAETSGEIWDLLDKDGQKTGKTMTRGADVPSGLYHQVVHIWVVNSKGEYLVQQRAQGVSWKPGMWAVTGGSAVSGEEPLTAALREVREEIGVTAVPAQMRLLARLKRTNSFCYVYRVLCDQEASAFTLQREEVDRVAWMTREQIEFMRAQGTFYDYGDAYFRMIWDRTRN